jgi:hypothetical protein
MPSIFLRHLLQQQFDFYESVIEWKADEEKEEDKVWEVVE